MVTQIFYFIFTPKIGEDFQFDEHIVQMGWNHHPVLNEQRINILTGLGNRSGYTNQKYVEFGFSVTQNNANLIYATKTDTQCKLGFGR